MSEFFKDDQLKSLKTHECMVFQIPQETILLLINNILEKNHAVMSMRRSHSPSAQ